METHARLWMTMTIDIKPFLKLVQPFMTQLLIDECAIKNHPQSVVEDTVNQFYFLLGLNKPTFIWLANPWQMHYGPGFITGYNREQIRVFDLQIRFAEEFRKLAKSQLGDRAFNLLYDAVQNAIPLRELLYLSRLTDEWESQMIVSSEPQRFPQNPQLGKLFFERIDAMDLPPKLKISKHIVDKIGKDVSWFSLEHFVGEPSPWRTKPYNSTSPFADPEFMGRLQWDDTPRPPLPNPQPMNPRSKGIEWTHYLRMHLAFAMFCRKYLNATLAPELEHQFNVLNDLTRMTSLLACFSSVCFICEPALALHRDDQFRFHCVNGPAIQYKDEYESYFWHNTRVPASAINGEVNVDLISNERNLEVMRVLLERYGIERYLVESGAVCFHEDDTGSLYRMEKEHDTLAFVGVTNSTPEVDGTFKRYFLQVPPTVGTAREAVAWTFNMSANDYRPIVET